jgi:NADH-quinone oxidoreductase subunit G
MSRYNGAVNGYFICDRGRFGYEFVNDEKRIKTVLIRSKKEIVPEPVNYEQLLSCLDQSLSRSKNVKGIGSPRASLESNFALMTLVGKENFWHGISKKEYLLTNTITEFLQHTGIRTPSLKQIEKADAILILGEDLTNTAPVIALALRQAVRNVPNEEAKGKGIQLWNDAPVRELAQNSKSPLFIATPFGDSLDEIAEDTFRASYGDIASLGFAVALNLDKKAPELKTDKKDIEKLAGKIAFSLKNAKNPLIISGVSSNEESIVNAALNISSALLSAGSKPMLSLVLPECNSMGLAFFPGKPFEDAFTLVENKEIDALVVLENDLFRRANEDSVNNLFKKSKQIIVLDHLSNKTAQVADVLLPAATFAESEGTFVNNEGRAQRFYKAIDSKNQLKESWRWIGDFIKIRFGNKEVLWNRLDDIVESMANELPVFSKLKKYKPDADFRMLNTKIPRQTMRFSGRTAMNANIEVSEPKLSQDPDSPLAFSMEGQQEMPPSSLVPFYWMPGWNSVQAMYNYVDEPGGSMKGGDPGIRLFESVKGIMSNYFGHESQNKAAEKDEWHIIPVYQIFGGEELSSVSSSVLQKTHEPFVLINQKDADIISINDGEFVQLEIVKINLRVKVKIDCNIIQGLAGLSVNLPGMPFVDVPGNGKFHKL